MHHRNWSHPHVSPALADLRGYPPAIVVSGTADPIVDDDPAFVRKLQESGNEYVVFFVRERMPHGYYFFPGLLTEGDEAFAAIAESLKARIKKSG